MTKRELKKDMDWLMLLHMKDVTRYIEHEHYGIAITEVDKLRGMIYYGELIGVLTCEEWQAINYQLIKLKGKIDLMSRGIK